MFTSWCPSASVQRLNTELLRGEGFSLLRFRRFQPPRLMAPKSLGEPQGATGGINFFPARWNFGEAHPEKYPPDRIFANDTRLSPINGSASPCWQGRATPPPEASY